MFEPLTRYVVRKVRKEFSDVRSKSYVHSKYRSRFFEGTVSYQTSMEGQVYV